MLFTLNHMAIAKTQSSKCKIWACSTPFGSVFTSVYIA